MEVEIKLHVLPTVAGGPDELFRRLAALDALAGHPLGPMERLTVRDVYYDTPDGALARARSGLRLRLENEAALVTLKRSRHQEGSLTAREEYEYPATGPHLIQVLALIRGSIGPDPVPLADFLGGRPAGPLVPVLTVATLREARSIPGVGTLVLDRIEYPGLSPDSFYDIEVEAAEGLEAEAPLRQMEAALQSLAGGQLAPASLSKLERGLRLKANPS